MLLRQRQEVQALPRELSASDTGLRNIVHEERVLDWEGALNARDTGGLATADGASIRRGALVRSDVLSRLTPSGRKALRAHGVRTIVDVRSAREVELDRDIYPLWVGEVAYLNVSFSMGSDEHAWEAVARRYEAAQSREELNRIDLEEHGVGIGAIVGAVADAPPGGVLVHCHAGKDRTGLIVALLLLLAGVSDEDIADDYALTALNLEPLIVDWLLEMGGDDEQQARLRRLAEPRREAMLDTLAHLRQSYGSAEQYLLDRGVTRDQIDRVRARLVGARADAT